MEPVPGEERGNRNDEEKTQHVSVEPQKSHEGAETG